MSVQMVDKGSKQYKSSNVNCKNPAGQAALQHTGMGKQFVISDLVLHIHTLWVIL